MLEDIQLNAKSGGVTARAAMGYIYLCITLLGLLYILTPNPALTLTHTLTPNPGYRRPTMQCPCPYISREQRCHKGAIPNPESFPSLCRNP